MQSKVAMALPYQYGSAYLQLGRQQLEDVVDLILESTREHLIGLVQHEHPDGVCPQGATTQHVVDATRGTNDDVHTSLKNAGVLADAGATDTGVALDLQGRHGQS